MLAALISATLLLGAAGYAIRRLYLDVQAKAKQIAVLEQDGRALRDGMAQMVEDFRAQRSSLEGAIRVLRSEREAANNRLAEAARRRPELAGDLLRDSLWYVSTGQAGETDPGPQPEVPGGSPSKPPEGGGGRDP